MSQEVTKWLAEIKALQQQLATTQKDRDAADTSAANWRKLYETEAQQRRTEVALTQQKLAALTAELEQFKGEAEPEPELQAPAAQGSTQTALDIRAELSGLQTPAELQQKLALVLLERNQLQAKVEALTQALKAEQAEHAHTRKTLTTALGDTVDLLTKERTLHGGQSS